MLQSTNTGLLDLNQIQHHQERTASESNSKKLDKENWSFLIIHCVSSLALADFPVFLASTEFTGNELPNAGSCPIAATHVIRLRAHTIKDISIKFWSACITFVSKHNMMTINVEENKSINASISISRKSNSSGLNSLQC